jgi:hypothetical protein
MSTRIHLKDKWPPGEEGLPALEVGFFLKYVGDVEGPIAIDGKIVPGVFYLVYAHDFKSYGEYGGAVAVAVARERRVAEGGRDESQR